MNNLLTIILVVALATTTAWAGLEDTETWTYQFNAGSTYHDDGYGAALTYNGTDGWLEFSFDGTDTAPPNGYSYFNAFLQMGTPQDWSAYTAIRFDAKVASSGTMSDRDYVRLIPRLDNNTDPAPDPDTLFDDDERAWQANKIDVTKNAAGWATFELNFDNVTDNGAGGYVSASLYDIESEFAGSTIARNNLESFRFATYLKQNRWLGLDETMTIYFDNIELIPEPATLGLLLIGGLALLRRRRK